METSYEISESAEKDWKQIISYTLDRFGKQQVHKYTEGLLNCLDALAFNSKKHKKLNLVDYDIIHKRCQKHYIFAQIRVLILAIYHSQIDLMIQLKKRLG